MDRLKAARKPIRALITRTCNEVDVLLRAEELDEVELTGKNCKLNELLENIQGYDQQILDLYLDNQGEDAYETEMLAIDEYISAARIAKIKIDRNLQKEVIHRPASEYSTAASTENRHKRKLKLPKIELLKFSGNLIDWLSWWSQFEKIHNDDELHTTDKFEYLRQAMVSKTKAEDIVDSFPATEENYPKAINALKERFGKKKLLVRIYVQELFKIALHNINKDFEISSVYDKLVSHIRALETLGTSMDQAALFLYPMVEASLPDDTLTAWQRSSDYEKDGSQEDPPKNEMNYLLQFLGQEVERETQRKLLNEYESNPLSKKCQKKIPNTHSDKDQSIVSSERACDVI